MHWKPQGLNPTGNIHCLCQAQLLGTPVGPPPYSWKQLESHLLSPWSDQYLSPSGVSILSSPSGVLLKLASGKVSISKSLSLIGLSLSAPRKVFSNTVRLAERGWTLGNSSLTLRHLGGVLLELWTLMQLGVGNPGGDRGDIILGLVKVVLVVSWPSLVQCGLEAEKEQRELK